MTNLHRWKRVLTLRKWVVLRWYYARRYGLEGSMLPKLGEGEFVSVRQRGPYLDITDERTGGLIRLVPYQPNHGVMVELWRDGKMKWRMHQDFKALAGLGLAERRDDFLCDRCSDGHKACACGRQ